MGPFPYQISVIFLRLTRLSTSQRYEPIKGVFHTATTRTSVLITSVPNMQSQGGQGEDCYIWWFVFFFLLLGTDKECGIWAGKAHLCRHGISHCWGRPRFVPLCLNVNKTLCWVVTEINIKPNPVEIHCKRNVENVIINRIECKNKACLYAEFSASERKRKTSWRGDESRRKCIEYCMHLYTSYLIRSIKGLLFP